MRVPAVGRLPEPGPARRPVGPHEYLKFSIVQFIKDTLWVAAVVCGGLVAGSLYLAKIIVKEIANAILPSWLLRCVNAPLRRVCEPPNPVPWSCERCCTSNAHDVHTANPLPRPRAGLQP